MVLLDFPFYVRGSPCFQQFLYQRSAGAPQREVLASYRQSKGWRVRMSKKLGMFKIAGFEGLLPIFVCL